MSNATQNLKSVGSVLVDERAKLDEALYGATELLLANALTHIEALGKIPLDAYVKHVQFRDMFLENAGVPADARPKVRSQVETALVELDHMDRPQTAASAQVDLELEIDTDDSAGKTSSARPAQTSKGMYGDLFGDFDAAGDEATQFVFNPQFVIDVAQATGVFGHDVPRLDLALYDAVKDRNLQDVNGWLQFMITTWRAKKLSDTNSSLKVRANPQAGIPETFIDLIPRQAKDEVWDQLIELLLTADLDFIMQGTADYASARGKGGVLAQAGIQIQGSAGEFADPVSLRRAVEETLVRLTELGGSGQFLPLAATISEEYRFVVLPAVRDERLVNATGVQVLSNTKPMNAFLNRAGQTRKGITQGIRFSRALRTVLTILAEYHSDMSTAQFEAFLLKLGEAAQEYLAALRNFAIVAPQPVRQAGLVTFQQAAPAIRSFLSIKVKVGRDGISVEAQAEVNAGNQPIEYSRNDSATITYGGTDPELLKKIALFEAYKQRLQKTLFQGHAMGEKNYLYELNSSRESMARLIDECIARGATVHFPSAPQAPSGGGATHALHQTGGTIGTAFVGDVHGPIISGPISAGRDVHIDTRGGDYAGGNIDKRRGTFVEGGSVNMEMRAGPGARIENSSQVYVGGGQPSANDQFRAKVQILSGVLAHIDNLIFLTVVGQFSTPLVQAGQVHTFAALVAQLQQALSDKSLNRATQITEACVRIDMLCEQTGVSLGGDTYTVAVLKASMGGGAQGSVNVTGGGRVIGSVTGVNHGTIIGGVFNIDDDD